MKACRAMRILMLVLGGLGLMCGIGPGELATETRNPWLAIPQIDGQIYADSQAEFQVAADSIQTIEIHIPAGGSHINYGTIHTKVNAESSDVAMQSSSGIDGLNLHIQLTAASGFQFQPGRNSVELEYRDVFGRGKYANFLLTFRAAPRPHAPGPELLAKTPEKRTGRTYAVVIGISRLSHASTEIASLKYADRDAASFAQFLKSPSGGGLTDDTLTLLTNDRATTQNINYNLSSFLARAQPQDTVLVYVAGYGAHDPQDPRNLYLLTADTKPEDIRGTSFSMDQMQRVFEQVLKAHRVVTIADTCHGYGVLSAGETSKNNNLINQYLERYAAKKERAVITASDISETSIEDARWDDGHGVFTYYLLKGLKGEADTNRDGVVTTGELFDYLERVVPEATGGKQNPRAMSGLATNLPISILRTSNARLDRGRISLQARATR